MIFVDTAFLIAWISPNDELHSKAIDLLSVYGTEEWLITDCILLEVGNSLAGTFRGQAIAAIENILTDETTTLVGLEPDLFRRAFELFIARNDKAWGMVDCVSFLVMDQFGVSTALTNDRHFVQAGFTALMRED